MCLFSLFLVTGMYADRSAWCAEAAPSPAVPLNPYYLSPMMQFALAGEASEERDRKAASTAPTPQQQPVHDNAEAKNRPGGLTFEIKGFEVEGNTLLDEDQLREALVGFTGSGKTAEDVEKARDTLERLYHKLGFPTVLVNIPEQTVDSGLVRFEVIESTVRRVRITGNRFFTMEKIKKELPSLQPGEILFLPRVQRDLQRINRHPDLRVAPVLMPGKRLGTIDVELKVKDKLPLHGSLEMNNRSTHDTSNMRVNALLRYDNLWMKEHSVSLQYQVSPKDMDEVRVFAVSYVLPAPWDDDHVIAVYAISSESDTAFGEGFETIGEGTIIGLRYVMPLTPYDKYLHSINFGIDYKDFDESTGFSNGEEDIRTPIKYLPLCIDYNSLVQDETGITRFSAGLNVSLRGLVSDREDFEGKREDARGNYLYLTAGIERTQKLPAGMGLLVKIDGQIADQPLIDNEQYSAGGMMSVRGYKETEALGDHALHGTVEINAPDLAEFLGLKRFAGFTPYVFFDTALLSLNQALAGEERTQSLRGAGIGIRGGFLKHFEFGLDWATALADTDRTESGDHRLHFMVKYQF